MCLTGKEPTKMSDIYCTTTSLPKNVTTKQFELQTKNSDQVLRINESLSKDYSTGYDEFPYS